MNTFKKIAAVTMAAATLATTMVSASAYYLPPTTYHYNNVKLVADYAFKDANVPVIYSSSVASPYTSNVFTYTSITGKLTEGKKLLRISTGPYCSAAECVQIVEEELPYFAIKDKSGNLLHQDYVLQAVSDRRGNVDIIVGGKSYLRGSYENEKFEYLGYGTFEHTFSFEGMALVGVPQVKVGGKSIAVNPRDVSVQYLCDNSERPSTTITYRLYLDPSELNEYKSVTVNGTEVDRVYFSAK